MNWLLIGLFALCNADSILIEFTVQNCTSNPCVNIKNPNGKIRLYGHDNTVDSPYGATEISEQAFIATEIPFTLNLEYPDNPSSLIYPSVTDANQAEYYIVILWDSDGNGYAECGGGDITIDHQAKWPNIDLDTNDEKQTFYVKQTDYNGECSGSIKVTFTVKDCTSNCLDIQNGRGKIALYGFDSNIADVSATKINEQMFFQDRVPFTETIYFPQNPENLIDYYNGNEADAEYYLALTWDSDGNGYSDCSGDISFDYNEKFPTVSLNNFEVELTEDYETQILYIKKISDDIPCGAAIYHVLYVKVLICLFYFLV